MFYGFLARLYLTRVLSFSFVVHPISCCFLLLGGSLSLSFLIYSWLGFRWYILLFCLVYVGGVYILFVYIAMFSPNVFSGLGYGFSFAISVFLLFWVSLLTWGLDCRPFLEKRHYVCSGGDGYGYCFFCLVLLLGFRLVSFVSSSKDSFFR